MLVWRKVVKPVPFADVLIFMSSISILLYLYRSPYRDSESMYSLLRFVSFNSQEVCSYHETKFTTVLRLSVQLHRGAT